MKIKIAAITVTLLLLPGVTITHSLMNTIEDTTEDLSSEFATLEYKRLSIKASNNDILLSHSTSTDSLKITVTTDYSLYRWLFEPVKISIAIENQGEEDQTLTFPTYQTCDFIVQNRIGLKIYRWSFDKLFWQEFKDVTIPVGETWWQNLTWRQIGTLFFPLLHYKVLPGKYYITGQIPTLDKTYEDTVEIRIAFGVVHPL